MNRSDIERLVHTWMSFWQGGDLGRFDDVHASDFVDQSSSGRPTDRAGFKAGIQELYRGLPDFRAETDDILIDEPQQLAAVRWHGWGTHRGTLMGQEPTGARLEFTGIEILRVADSRVVERWGEMDTTPAMQQIARARR